MKQSCPLFEASKDALGGISEAEGVHVPESEDEEDEEEKPSKAEKVRSGGCGKIRANRCDFHITLGSGTLYLVLSVCQLFN